MTVVRYKNQSDYAFLLWMGSFPNSGHSLDEERFYQFAKTVAVYRNKKWLDHDFFWESVQKHPNYLDEEKIGDYWQKLVELVKFYKTAHVPTVGHGRDDGDYGLYQMGVNKGRMYRVRISEEEYYRGGATKDTMRRAEYFGN